MESGWDLKDALTTPVEKRSKNAKYIIENGLYIDHWGKAYKTKSEMAEDHGINLHALSKRLSKGWTLEEALSIPLGGKRHPEIKRKCKPHNKHVTDPWGKEFNNYGEMADFHNIPKDVLNDRRKRAWSLERALTTPVGSTNSAYKVCYDHTGRQFTSEQAMCRYWKVSKAAYRARLKKGMSLKDALTTPVKQKKQSITYNGVTYKKLSDFLEEYKITMSDYYNRTQLGWSLDRIVNDLGNGCFKPCEDHLGNSYNSLKEMLATYEVSESMYYQRKEDGWTLEEILTIPSNSIFVSHYRKLFQLEGTDYYDYKCPICNKQHIFTKSEIRQHYLLHMKSDNIAI